MTATRLAIVVSHPIQHFVSLYRALAAVPDIQLRLFFGSRIGLEPYFDVGMNRAIAWKMDLLSGYDHCFLTPADGPAPGGETVPPPSLHEAIAGFRPDAVIVYGYATPLALAAARAARSLGARTLMISDSELRSPRPLPKRMAKAIALPRVLRRFDAFLTVGDENERYYYHYGVPAARLFRSPFTIDEGAFDTAALSRPGHRGDLLDRLGIAGDPFLALFVGKLSPRKHPADLLAAVEHAANRGRRPVRAVFAGDGVLREHLQAHVAERRLPAHLLGFVNVDELPGIYAAVDVLAHPSEADPHPLVCSEAACVGLPMVLSDRVGAEGPTDIARQGRNAIVYPMGDVAALGDALVRLASDPDLTRQMGADSRRIFTELDLRRSVAGVRNALAYLGLAP